MNAAQMNIVAEQVVGYDNAGYLKTDDYMVYDSAKPVDEQPIGHYRFTRIGRAGIASYQEFTEAMVGEESQYPFAIQETFATYRDKMGAPIAGYPAKSKVLTEGVVTDDVLLTIRRLPPQRVLGQEVSEYVGGMWLPVMYERHDQPVRVPLIAFSRNTLNIVRSGSLIIGKAAVAMAMAR